LPISWHWQSVEHSEEKVLPFRLNEAPAELDNSSGFNVRKRLLWVLALLSQVTNEGQFSADVVVELIGLCLINGTLSCKLFNEPLDEAVVI
jgi:hypothetical protein